MYFRLNDENKLYVLKSSIFSNDYVPKFNALTMFVHLNFGFSISNETRLTFRYVFHLNGDKID